MKTMRRPASAQLLALALGLLPVGVPARAQQQSPVPPAHVCAAPPEAYDAATLPGTFVGVALGRLRIMVVGSASTSAGGTSSVEAAWPNRLARRLRSLLAPAEVEVAVFGGRGTVASEHAKILEREVPRFRPHLVIWQLGTVEAARGLPAEEMSDAVQEAASRLRAVRGELADLVLMDMQFSRFFRANANVEAYRDQLRAAAGASGAQLFSRWSLMKYWVDNDRLDLERAPREQRTAVADALHGCIARVLAGFILDGIGREAR